MKRLHSILLSLFILLPLIGAIANVSASPNIGLLRVSSFLCPREVAPGATFPVSLDVEYAIQSLPNEATIRGAVYDGSIISGNLLWQSDPTLVSDGGDQVWNFTLNAPTTEGTLNLTAYAFFLENGTWAYFDNAVNGPGAIDRAVKIGTTASLDVNIGASGIAVTVDGTTKQTSATGDALFPVAVGGSSSVSVPLLAQLQNSTRIIFSQWSDGLTEPQRQVTIDGDVNLTAQYRIQYLLTVSNSSTVEAWYDKGAVATIDAPTSESAPWPLNFFGVTETFQGWSGDIKSTLPEVNITMDSPKTVAANMATNYQTLALPTIFGLGIIVAIISLALLRKTGSPDHGDQMAAEEPAKIEPLPEPNPTCPSCGQVTEADWVHCIKCGFKLKEPHSATT